MRTSIILARKHGAKHFTMMCGQQVPFTEQNDIIRQLLALGGTSDTAAEIQFWTSDAGITRILRFKSREEAEQANKDKAAMLLDQQQREAAAKPEEPAEEAKAVAPVSPLKSEWD